MLLHSAYNICLTSKKLVTLRKKFGFMNFNGTIRNCKTATVPVSQEKFLTRQTPAITRCPVICHFFITCGQNDSLTMHQQLMTMTINFADPDIQKFLHILFIRSTQ